MDIGKGAALTAASILLISCSGSDSANSYVPAAPAADASQPVAADASASVAAPTGQWFAADANFERCKSSRAPAARIQDVRDAGLEPVINETQGIDGTLQVEVGEPLPGGLETRYVTYYGSLTACEAGLAQENSIPTKYQ